MIGAVVGANAFGLRATARLQLGLAGAARRAPARRHRRARCPRARAAQLDAVRPARLVAVGTAANLLMLSVHRLGGGRAPGRRVARPGAPAAARDRSPRSRSWRALPRPRRGDGRRSLGGAPARVPLADLMAARPRRRRPRRVTAGAAVLLTMGTMNAYVAGASRLAGALAAAGSMPRALARPGGAAGGHRRGERGLLAALAAGLVDVDPIVRAISTALRRGLRRRHGRRGPAARRAPARDRRALAGARRRGPRLLGALRRRARGHRAARARVRQCPCGWRSLAGSFSRSWLSCSAIA